MKIIFFDIDGTLVSEKTHRMLESTKEAIKKARENGHLCIINTGRSKRLVIGSVSEMAAFDGFVLGCGTMIIVKDQVLFHQSFSKALGERLLEAFERYRIDAVLEGEENIYQRPLEEMYHKPFHDYMASFDDFGVGSFSEGVDRFDKFFSFIDTEEKLEQFAKEFENELDFVDREHGFYEVLPKGFSKAKGMEILVDALELSMEDTVAIGDSNNDYEMFQAAAISIAMGNATEAIKDIADYVTTDVDEDGIYHALEWLGVL